MEVLVETPVTDNEAKRGFKRKKHKEMDIGEHESGVAKLWVLARIKIFRKGNGPEYILLIRHLC